MDEHGLRGSESQTSKNTEETTERRGTENKPSPRMDADET
jgi:hypothetical protein